MIQKNQFIVILTTTNSLPSAEKIATALIKEKLAACVNIIPKIKSIYSWKKKICKEEEYLMILKTQKKLYLKVQKRIRKLHPYEVPEIVSLSINQGNISYLKWIMDETK